VSGEFSTVLSLRVFEKMSLWARGCSLVVDLVLSMEIPLDSVSSTKSQRKTTPLPKKAPQQKYQRFLFPKDSHLCGTHLPLRAKELVPRD
jgi:hypothetical protein